jgi:serine/threonine-protein kinase HipA
MTDALEVFLHEQYLGVVTPDRRNPQRVRLSWDASFVPGAVRLTEAFGAIPGINPRDEAASNFFGGYTPEGNQRKAMADERAIDSDDLFALLREFGGSIAGAVSFRPSGEPEAYKPSYTRLDSKTVAARLRQAVSQHDLGMQDDSRSMLPGFQPKLLLAWFEGEWFEPHGRAHSTHILKPELSNRPDAIHNEYYSHLLARHMGLASFDSELVSIGKTRVLSIERYDRAISGTTVAPIHQEDTAQAMGLDWMDADAKFQDPNNPSRRGRPSAADVATLMASVATSTNPLAAWLSQLIYHVLVGNNDAHAKNVGLLHTAEDTTITQLYDAVPNLFQEGRIKWDLAMSIDGVFDHRRVSVERIVAEAESWRAMPVAEIEDVVSSTITRFQEALDAVKAPRGVAELLPEQLRWNADRLKAGTEISQPKRTKMRS